MIATDGHRKNSRTDRRHHRRMAGEHAEIALDAGNVNLIDFSGEADFFGRDEIEVEGGHGIRSFRCHPRA